MFKSDEGQTVSIWEAASKTAAETDCQKTLRRTFALLKPGLLQKEIRPA